MMISRPRICLTLALLLCAFAPRASAITVLLGDLTPIGGTNSTGSGFGAIVLDGASMTLSIGFSDLLGDATAAGLYGSTFYPLLIPFPSSTSLSLDGTFALTPEQVAEILAQTVYFQVSSTAFPDGEISGWITQTAEGSEGGGGGVGEPPPIFTGEVPEPSSVLLGLTGLAALGLLKRRSRAVRRSKV